MVEPIYESPQSPDQKSDERPCALLVDVDSMSKIINNAIGKFIEYYESNGHRVVVLKLKYPAYPHRRRKTVIDASKYSAVRVSIIFTRNKNMVEVNGCEDVMFGGTGYDLNIKLPDEIDNLNARLYGKARERIEYITRGCVRKCYFCLVWQKEGYLYEYRDIEKILSTYNGERIRFFDNNFLAWERANETMRLLIEKNVPCSFNEGLDLRLINDENAELLSKLNYYPCEYIFAFDSLDLLETVEEKTAILKRYISRSWKLKYYIFTDASKPIKDLLKRINWCRDREILPYVMRYDNCYNSPIKNFYTDIAAWTNQAGHFKNMNFEQFIIRRHPNKVDRAEQSLEIFNNNSQDCENMQNKKDDSPVFHVPYPAVHLNQPTGKIVPGNVNAQFNDGTLKIEAEFNLNSKDYTTLRREIGFHMTKLGMGLGVINDK